MIWGQVNCNIDTVISYKDNISLNKTRANSNKEKNAHNCVCSVITISNSLPFSKKNNKTMTKGKKMSNNWKKDADNWRKDADNCRRWLTDTMSNYSKRIRLSNKDNPSYLASNNNFNNQLTRSPPKGLPPNLYPITLPPTNRLSTNSNNNIRLYKLPTNLNWYKSYPWTKKYKNFMCK